MGMMYVIGGGRVAPNPSNEMDIYNPGTNTWCSGLPLHTMRGATSRPILTALHTSGYQAASQ